MKRQGSFQAPAGQRGVVLAVVLILLLVMTVLAIASLSGTLMEETISRMAGSPRLTIATGTARSAARRTNR